MFGVVSTFIKPYLGWIVGAGVALVVGAFSWMAVDLAMTKSALDKAEIKLEAAQAIVEAQTRAIEAVDRVEEYRTEVNRALRRFNAQIMEAEGADQQVPPAVARVWANGIDSLRASELDSNSGAPENVPAP